MRNGFLVAFLLGSALAQPAPTAYALSTVAGTANSGDGGRATAAMVGNLQGVAVDASGNLYIADTDNHRIRKIDSSGIITLFAGTGAPGFSGDGGPATQAALNLPYGLAADGAGNVYIADLGNNRVRHVGPDGAISTIAGSGQNAPLGDGGPATDASLNAPRNLALDPAGNLYISEFLGQRVRKLSADGQISTVAGTGVAGFAGDGSAAAAAQLAYPAGLALDSHGTLYVADSGNGCIRQIVAGMISTLLGNSAGVSLLTPTAIAIDSAGTIYIADQSNIVRAYTAAGAWIDFAGTGGLGFAGDGGPVASAILAAPHDLAVDARGQVHIADGMRLRRVSNGVIETEAGDPHLYGIGDGGAATAAPLFRPYAVALDHSGKWYFVETGAQRVRQVDATGKIGTTGGTGVAGPAGDGGAATQAQFHSPASLAVDAFGNILVADTGNHRVRQITPSGVVSTIAGTGLSGMGKDGVPGTQTPLNAPQGVCADHTGVFYVVDTGNQRLLRVAPGATAVVTVAGNGTAGYSGDGGPALSAQLDQPSACAVDTAGNLFLADTLNHSIREISVSGVISTVAGNGSAGFSGDGQAATAASLTGPSGVAVTDDGRIFIADTGNNRIRLVSSDGNIQTIAGGEAAPLNGPGGLALDGSGDVYFAETGSSLIRKLTLTLSAAGAAAALSGPPVSIVNAASLLPGPVAPGELATISGIGLGPAAGVAGTVSAAGLVASSAGGTQVLFDGVAAPVLFAQSGQINAQVPYSVAGSAATNVQVVYSGQPVGSAVEAVAAAAPALFSVVSNADGSANSQAAPAGPNTVVTLFATGEGLDASADLTGQIATGPLTQPQLPVALSVGGIPAQILSANSAAGLLGILQLTARLPGGLLPPGQAAAILTVGSSASSPIGIWLK